MNGTTNNIYLEKSADYILKKIYIRLEVSLYTFIV